MKITMLGHSTVLIEIEGKQIITDPYFGTWGHIAYKRVDSPAMTREQLQDVDMVLLSHNHWDHIDQKYLGSLADSVPVLAPKWASWMTKLQGGKNVLGKSAWEEHRLGPVAITVVPAVHVAATVGFVLEGEGKQIYFAGDTYYHSFMQEIGRRFQLHAALIPVTTFLIPMTMGEKGAVRAVQALRPQVVIPIHLGVQPRSPLMRTRHTPQGFARRMQGAGLQTEMVLLSNGQSWTA